MHKTAMPQSDIIYELKGREAFLNRDNKHGTDKLTPKHSPKTLIPSKHQREMLALYPATYKPVRSKIDEKQQDWTNKQKKKYPGSKIHTIKEQISF